MTWLEGAHKSQPQGYGFEYMSPIKKEKKNSSSMIHHPWLFAVMHGLKQRQTKTNQWASNKYQKKKTTKKQTSNEPSSFIDFLTYCVSLSNNIIKKEKFLENGRGLQH